MPESVSIGLNEQHILVGTLNARNHQTSLGAIRLYCVIQSPFFAGVAFLSRVLPQILGLTNHAWSSSGALDKTILILFFSYAQLKLARTNQSKGSAKLLLVSQTIQDEGGA